MTDWRDPTEAEVEHGPLIGGLTLWQALCLAGMSDATKPLAGFICDPRARRTITANGWLAFSDYIESLGKTRRAGNPSNQPDLDVREAARWVDQQKRRWRIAEQHGRKLTGRPRVPGKKFSQGRIQAATDRIAARRDIAKDSARHFTLTCQIENALKTRRF